MSTPHLGSGMKLGSRPPFLMSPARSLLLSGSGLELADLGTWHQSVRGRSIVIIDQATTHLLGLQPMAVSGASESCYYEQHIVKCPKCSCVLWCVYDVFCWLAVAPCPGDWTRRGQRAAAGCGWVRGRGATALAGVLACVVMWVVGRDPAATFPTLTHSPRDPGCSRLVHCHCHLSAMFAFTQNFNTEWFNGSSSAWSA